MGVSPVNAFTPASEVTDPDRFAGRDGELQRLAWALQSEGVQMVIYGNRGVGKSSLAHQLDLLSRGNAEVSDRLADPPPAPLDFLTVYFRCDDSVDSVSRLLLRLLSDDDALAAWVPFRVVSKQGASELGGRLSVKVVSLSAKGAQSTTSQVQELETDLVSVFQNALEAIMGSGVARDGVLLVIDEFDRVADRQGMASLLKVLGPKGVKFALVGVATDVQDLILDHQSVARQLSDGTVEVPPMTDAEMRQIIDKAEELLEHRYSFSEDARAWISETARGHPFYVHLVGKHALLKTIERGETDVTKEAAGLAMAEIALKGSAPVQEALYKTAIGHSYVRESILKAFASETDNEIHTTELYARLRESLGISAAQISVYVGHLASAEYGTVLSKTRSRYYCFKDSLFKAYAAARPYQLSPEEDGRVEPNNGIHSQAAPSRR